MEDCFENGGFYPGSQSCNKQVGTRSMEDGAGRAGAPSRRQGAGSRQRDERARSPESWLPVSACTEVQAPGPGTRGLMAVSLP